MHWFIARQTPHSGNPAFVLFSLEFTLFNPLGNWIPSILRTQQWFSQIDPTTNAHYLYHDNDIWRICYPCSRPRQHLYYDGDYTNKLPPNLTPITVRYKRGVLTASNYCPIIPTITTLSPPVNSSLSRYIRTLPKLHQWILGSILSLTKQELTNLSNCISTGNFVLGSD